MMRPFHARLDRRRRRAGVAILTALDVEYEAVRRHLRIDRVFRHPAGTVFETGETTASGNRVALVRTGPGNTTTALIAERAIAAFRPKALLFVGVAGSLHDDVRLGDIVVSSKVYAFHGGKVEGVEFFPRPQVWQAPHILDQLAGHVFRTGSWAKRLHDHPTPTVHFKPLAGGEVLVNTRLGTVAEHLRLNYNDAVAVDMESVGVACAGHLNGSLPVLSIRGISDLADGAKATTDHAGWQTVAAANAAAFAVSLVDAILSDTVRAAADFRKGDLGLSS
ncbi:5'-methylthioadenosine/S-adenosylhomocysteine nucleosidase family protein [Virgisporangium ochraceum]|nr:5'-methylthioadenosine/S-adenosylhomocysteine nucleosidase [Virgisporangium ochraceum]